MRIEGEKWDGPRAGDPVGMITLEEWIGLRMGSCRNSRTQGGAYNFARGTDPRSEKGWPYTDLNGVSPPRKILDMSQRIFLESYRRWRPFCKTLSPLVAPSFPEANGAIGYESGNTASCTMCFSTASLLRSSVWGIARMSINHKPNKEAADRLRGIACSQTKPVARSCALALGQRNIALRSILM